MDTLTLISKLLKGGFKLDDAAQIVVMLSETFKYNWPDALVKLEDVYQYGYLPRKSKYKQYLEG